MINLVVAVCLLLLCVSVDFQGGFIHWTRVESEGVLWGIYSFDDLTIEYSGCEGGCSGVVKAPETLEKDTGENVDIVKRGLLLCKTGKEGCSTVPSG